MTTSIIRLFDEVSTAQRALEALAAEGFPRDGLNLMAHQEHIDAPEAMAGWAPRVIAVPGWGRSWRSARSVRPSPGWLAKSPGKA